MMSGIGDCQRAGFWDGAELGGEGKKAEVSVFVGEEKIAATTPARAVLRKLGATATKAARARARPPGVKTAAQRSTNQQSCTETAEAPTPNTSPRLPA